MRLTVPRRTASAEACRLRKLLGASLLLLVAIITTPRQVAGETAIAQFAPNHVPFDCLTRATDNVGQWRDYIYDPNGNLIGENLRSGNTAIESASAEYNLQDRKTSSTDSGGFRTAFDYDNLGNVVRITNPDNYSVGFDYDPKNHWTRAVDAAGNAVTRRLDLDGKPRGITDPNGDTSSYETTTAGRFLVPD